MSTEKQSAPLKERILYTTPTDDRSRMRTVANNLILHLHPTKVPKDALRFSYTWGLGGLSTLLALILIVTGILLMFRYDASIERAYTSIQFLETQIPFGSFLRGLHHWAANLLLVTAFLHMVRVFVTGGYKKSRGTNWIIGIVLLLLVVVFNFTGYLLPWDQLAYWAVTVATSLLSYFPVFGPIVSNFMLAGSEVGQGALRNFYAIHVAVLPLTFLLMMTYHFWKVRKDGGISQPVLEKGKRAEKVTTLPHLIQIEVAAGAILIAVLAIWVMLVPAPLEALANPAHPPNPAKAAWYFMGLQELLLHMHPLAALLLPGIVLAGIAAIPFVDKKEDDIGVYFRSKVGTQAAILGALLSAVLMPILVLADEYWIDLPGWLPFLSTLVSNGLIPMVLSLGALAFIYWLFRRALHATRSESLLGLFVFLIISLILLTIVGIFFRGANMALILPF